MRPLAMTIVTGTFMTKHNVGVTDVDDIIEKTSPNGTSPSGAPVRVRLTPYLWIVIVALSAFAVGLAVYRLEEVVGLVAAAVVLALLTLPLKRRLSVMGDGPAIAATAVISLGMALAVGLVALRDLRAQAAAVADLVNSRISDVESSSTAGRVIESLRIESAIEGWLARVPDLIVVGEQSGTGVGRQLIALITVIILAAFLQSSGGGIVDWFTSRWPRDVDRSDAERGGTDPVSPRSEIRGLLVEIETVGIAAVRRSALLVAACCAAVSIMCDLLGVPGAIVLGLWSGAWFAVPTIGWAVGLAPLVVVAWVDGAPSVWSAVAGAVATAAVATIARRRFIDRPTIRLGVGPYVVGLAIGVAMGGMVGSVIGLTIVAAVGVVATTERTLSAPSPWMVPTDGARTVAGVIVPTGWRGALLAMFAAAAGVVVWTSLLLATEAVVWLMIGAFVAVAISRPLAFMVNRLGLHRNVAIAILLVTGSAIATLVTITGASNGAAATTSVADDLPEVVDDLEESPLIGSWLRNYDAAVWIENQVNDLPQRVRSAQPAEWLPAVGARLMDLFWTTLIAVALLIDGRRIVDRSTRLVPARGRRQFIRLTGAVGTALGGYAAGAALVAGINGAVVFAIAVVVGIGLAPVLAAWAFVWNFVPQIGGFIGGIPLILFALIAGPTQALIASIAFVIYQFVENNLIQPTVIGAAIDVPPWGTLVAALAGAAAAGVIGAIVVTPLVGVFRVVRAELGRADFPGATVHVEHGSLTKP